MIMAQFDDWIDGINTYIASRADSASNVPRIIAVHAVRSVMREFLTESGVWVHKTRTLSRSTEAWTLIIPRDTFICKIWQLHGCANHLSDQLYYEHPNIINLSDLSSNDRKHEALDKLQVSLSITQDSLECPMFIYDKYYDGILSGALAALQVMPGKAWSEPSMVSYHQQAFSIAIRKAKADASNQFNRTKSSTTIPPSFM